MVLLRNTKYEKLVSTGDDATNTLCRLCTLERGSDLCVQSPFCLPVHDNKFLPAMPSVLLEVAVLMLECVLALKASLHGWPQE